MKDSMRDELMICVGKLKGMLSMIDFDAGDEQSIIVNNCLNDVANDMELILKRVDDASFLKGGDDDDA